MTVTDDATTTPAESTALSPTAEKGRIALRSNPTASLKELAEQITEEPPLYWGGTDLVPFPAPAPTLVITDDDRAALMALPEVFGKVQPTERRALSPEEVKAAYDEHEVLKTIETLIASRRDAIKTTVKHHFDVMAEEENRAVPKPVIKRGTNEVVVEASPRDADGHYVLGKKGEPERWPIPGTNMAWSREFRGGLTSLSGARLKELYEAGEVSKEDYYAFTKEQRVFDEEKARASLAKNPRLYDLLVRITTRGGVGSSIWVRKNTPPKK
jgi:hypothetical protein